jgi:multiple sugar transport system substrate-binding protein/sn-glycerol 3-phosphate transport system substrate-binding protein
MLLLVACPAPAPAEAPAEAPAAEAEATAAPAEEAAEAPAATGECAPATDGEYAGIDPSGQTIIWWHQHSGSREEKMLPMIEEFNSTNPCGITVEAQNQGGYDDIRDKVNASTAAGEQPAALIVGYQNDQAFYQLNDTLVDLNTLIDDATWGLTAEEKADFFPTFLEQGVHPVFDGQRLGFPPNRSMEVMFYNKTWGEELGFAEAPTTPEEFKEQACAAAAANGDGSGGYILRDDASAVASWAFAFGGDVLTEDGTGYDYSNAAVVEAMTFLKGMVDEGCAFFFTEGFPNPELANRRALFTQGSSSGIPFYLTDLETAAAENGTEVDELAVLAIPHTTAEPVQNIYGADVMITRTTPEQELAAWIFVKWFTTPEVQAQWVEASNYFQTRAATGELIGDYVSENPQWGQAAALLPYSAYEPQLISYQAVRDAASQAFNEIMQGADIQATLDALTASANEMQEELMAEIQ